VLRDEQEPPILQRLSFDFGLSTGQMTGLTSHPLWSDEESELRVWLENEKVQIEQIKFGVMLRLNW
jgi:hypothetical protein